MSQFAIALLVEAKAVRHSAADEWKRCADRRKAFWLLLSVWDISRLVHFCCQLLEAPQAWTIR